MKKEVLSDLESTMLIAGSGIGTGILTLPYAIGKIGLFGALIALLIAYLVSGAIYLMICEMTRNSKDSKELLGILKEHLFYGKKGKILSKLFFILLVLMILENLIVYILCATEILNNLFGISILVSKILFYIMASIVILFGIRGISNGEKVSVSLIFTVIMILMILSLFNINNSISLGFGRPDKVLAVYSLFMFAFSSIFSLVQVTNYIENKKSIRKVAISGLSINAILTIVFAIVALIASKEVTSIATIGITESLNNTFVKVICSVFVLLAMFSSYWTSGLAFSDIIEAEFKTSKRVSWLICTIPTIILAVVIPFSILDYIQIGAGALSIILILVILPAYYHAVKKEKKPLLGKFARSKLLIAMVAIFTILMAIASFIPLG